MVVATLALLALAAPHPAWSANPTVFLSWHAPYGSPGATQTLVAKCTDDPTVRDTLYLTFETGRNAPTLYGMAATIYFRAMLGDTLGRFWWFGGGERNPRNIRIEWARDSCTGCTKPWHASGPGSVMYDRTSGSGRLNLLYAVPANLAAPVADSTLYCFARLLFPRPRPGELSCDKPICIEWGIGEFSFELGAQDAHPGREGARYASWNSPHGEVCASYRDVTKARPWRPREGTRR